MITSDKTGTLIAGKRDISLFMLMSLRHALALEIKGLKGRYSANLQACALLGLPKRTRRDKTLKALDLLIKEKKQQREKEIANLGIKQKEMEFNAKILPFGGPHHG